MQKKLQDIEIDWFDGEEVYPETKGFDGALVAGVAFLVGFGVAMLVLI